MFVAHLHAAGFKVCPSRFIDGPINVSWTRTIAGTTGISSLRSETSQSPRNFQLSAFAEVIPSRGKAVGKVRKQNWKKQQAVDLPSEKNNENSRKRSDRKIWNYPKKRNRKTWRNSKHFQVESSNVEEKQQINVDVDTSCEFCGMNSGQTLCSCG